MPDQRPAGSRRRRRGAAAGGAMGITLGTILTAVFGLLVARHVLTSLSDWSRSSKRRVRERERDAEKEVRNHERLAAGRRPECRLCSNDVDELCGDDGLCRECRHKCYQHGDYYD